MSLTFAPASLRNPSQKKTLYLTSYIAQMAFVYYERKEVHQLENQEQPLKNPIKEHITFWYQLIKPTILPWMEISTYWVKSFKHCISLTRFCFPSFITGTCWRSECYFCSQHDEGCCFALCPSLQSRYIMSIHNKALHLR